MDRDRKNQGSVMIESALAMVLLFSIISFMIDSVFVIKEYSELVYLTQESTRFASVATGQWLSEQQNPIDCSLVQKALCDNLNSFAANRQHDSRDISYDIEKTLSETYSSLPVFAVVGSRSLRCVTCSFFSDTPKLTFTSTSTIEGFSEITGSCLELHKCQEG